VSIDAGDIYVKSKVIGVIFRKIHIFIFILNSQLKERARGVWKQEGQD
jgi:hypothetical protein